MGLAPAPQTLFAFSVQPGDLAGLQKALRRALKAKAQKVVVRVVQNEAGAWASVEPGPAGPAHEFPVDLVFW